ncbi:Ras-related protein Rab-14 [Entamoeba marina]
MDPCDDYTFKYILLGDHNSGKTTIFELLKDNRLPEPYRMCYPEFFLKSIYYDRNVFKLIIWDTAGQERFVQMTRSYYRGTVICYLVFDVTNKQSFDNIDRWLTQSKSLTDPSLCPISYVLIGNKSDLSDQRQVSYEEADNYAKQHEFSYIETAALQRDNISSLLVIGLDDLLQKHDKEINERIEKKRTYKEQSFKRTPQSKCSIS